MEKIGEVIRTGSGHVYMIDNYGAEISLLGHVGKSLYVGDYDALMKELNECDKYEKAK